MAGVPKYCRLEQCLKEIAEYADELSSGTLHQSVNAVDALKQITDSRLIDKHTCHDVSMDAVQQMLKQMVSILPLFANNIYARTL